MTGAASDATRYQVAATVEHRGTVPRRQPRINGAATAVESGVPPDAPSVARPADRSDHGRSRW